MAAKLGLVLAIACALYVYAHAQVSTSGCTAVLLNLSSCLEYITGNGSRPAAACCSQLDTVVRSQPQCLCLVLGPNNAAAALGFNINQSQALSLPGACDVKTPNPTLCSAVTGSPIASPVPTAPNSLLPTQPLAPTVSPAPSAVNRNRNTPTSPATTNTNANCSLSPAHGTHPPHPVCSVHSLLLIVLDQHRYWNGRHRFLCAF